MTTCEPPLGTPEEEAALCRAAWDAHPSKWGWHIHHEILCEDRLYPIEERIAYILTSKAPKERALRLRLLRPVIDDAMVPIWKTYDDAMAAIQKTYADAMAAIQKTYDDARVPIWKTYDDARAAIQKTYDDAMAAIQKTYDDAMAAIWKTYADAMAAIHARECPNCPWDGESIFGGAA
jgi:hypothetical protein